MKQKNIINLFILISLIGILDASYLTFEHFSINNIICNINDTCNIVLTSKYAEILGVPLAILGLMYYLTIFINSFLFKITKYTGYKLILLYLPIFSFFFSIWLVYLQLFILNSICIYCMASAIISTMIFILSIMLNKSKRKNIL